jgi:ribosome-binding protein aMBF1 (putative translation factor)
MRPDKRKKLEAAGFTPTTVEDFLGLTPEESDYIELKLALCRRFKEIRLKRRMSQATLAKMLKSSQSRVAKIEAGDASVSVDLVMKSLLVVGASRKDIAKAIAT